MQENSKVHGEILLEHLRRHLVSLGNLSDNFGINFHKCDLVRA